MSRSLGLTTVMILTALERRARYGLEIVNGTGLFPGTVYTTLRRLERRGQIEGSWEDAEVAEAERRPRRRYYVLTPAGVEALETARERLEMLGVELPAGLSVVRDGR
ncbi:MAG: helix-turn-helix transcriptional regulator [Gemmatimonadota bacterium]|jgi:DNA-binding PadR family transcriptional regulator